MLEENLLPAQGGTGVGVCAVRAFKPVSLSGGRATGETSGQPGVGPPLPAWPWSCGRSRCRLSRRGATVPTAATTTTATTATTAMMDGKGQRLAVVVVLLRGV